MIKLSSITSCISILVMLVACDDSTQSLQPVMSGSTGGIEGIPAGSNNGSGGSMTGGESTNLSGGTEEGGTEIAMGGISGGDEVVGGNTGSSSCVTETCDAQDNDCDGKVDEELVCQCSEDTACYAGPPATRGLGECRDGRRECDSNGEQWQACIGSVTPAIELCDQRDNDCDGLVDEQTDSSCGCEAEGNEKCDGVDNDCDGVIDEEITRPCLCDPEGERMQVCRGGQWTGCENTAGMNIMVGTSTINLPELTPNCPFGQGDNLEPEGGVFTARVEQTATFDLPPGAQLCGFSLTGSNADFYFDDELMLLLNDIPLIGSVNFASRFELLDGLPRYDWSRVRGLSTQDLGEASCIEGATECQIPGTQSNGELRIAFDNRTNNRLASTAINGQHLFKVVVVGDNDPDLDCAHSGLNLEVSYDYLVQP